MFISELAKFLSFMHDEDRDAVLDGYDDLFDEVTEEEKLMTLLMSPTRQAVLIARAYDSDVPTPAGEMPRFLQVVENARAAAEAQGLIKSAADEDVVEESVEYAEEDAPEEEPVMEDQVSLFDPVVEEDEGAEAEEEDAAEEESEEEPLPEEEELPAQAEEAVETEDAPETEEAEAEPEDAVPQMVQTEDEINAFVADFERKATALVEGSGNAEEAAESEEPAVPAAEEVAAAAPAAEAAPASGETVLKAKPFLLVLYILFAVPITLLVLAVLLLPAAAIFGIAVSSAVAGAVTMSAVFSGFAVLADILVVLGCALVIIGVAILFIWLFVWFMAAVFIGFIKAVFALGRKWCYKEVPAV